MRGWSGYVWEPRYRVTGCESPCLVTSTDRGGLGAFEARDLVRWWGMVGVCSVCSPERKS